MKKKGYKWKEENAVRFPFAPSVLPSAASLCCSFTSLSFSLSLSHFLFLHQNPNPNRDHNRNIHKQSPDMDGDSTWSARLSSASRRYQSALQSRSGSPSLLPPIQFIFPLSSLPPSPIQDEVSVIQNFKLLQLSGVWVWGLDFRFLDVYTKRENRGITWKLDFPGNSSAGCCWF